jgi:hypothetical protein
MKKIRSLALAGLFVLFAAQCGATVITENFTNNPAQDGWRIFGNTNLFQWDPTNQNLQVTWDSSQPNSYFYLPLGTILTTNDDFSVAFDIQLSDVSIENWGFEISIGLFNYAQATGTNFFRGTGYNSPDLAEFDYFPDFGWGPTLSTTASDTNSVFVFLEDYLALDPGVTYHVVLLHAAGAAAVSGQVFTNGQLYTALPYAYVSTNFTDFRLDTISVSSYNSNGWWGSILAHGSVDNFIVTLPPPPVQDFSGILTNKTWQVQFISRSDWLYTLERTTNFVSWIDASAPTGGNGTNMFLQDTNGLVDKAFYRVRAERP